MALKRRVSEAGQQNKPQFAVYRNPLLHRLLFRGDHYYVNGPQSCTFNRKKYELPIESLELLSNQSLGFTNQILQQRLGNNIHLFVPVYIALKVKSINEIDLQELTAKITCALIIYIYVENLPQEVMAELRTNVFVQLNREGFLLNTDTENLKLKEYKQYLQFTVRQTLQADIQGDIFLTPFETLNLILSMTVNSLQIKSNVTQSILEQEPKSIKRQKQVLGYTVSFNCMRCPDKGTITFLQNCQFGVYDLAEKLLAAYPSNLNSFNEIKAKFLKWVEKAEEEAPIFNMDAQQATLQKQNIKVPDIRRNSPLKINDTKTGKSRLSELNEFKSYFQYNHFVVPIYKMPGNALATIFIPMFMLAILSISLSVESGSSISEDIGTIATFVLSFIALIPSIKSQIPPSQQLTLSEIIAYIQALNCMLSLLNSFVPKMNYKKHFFSNPFFIISLTIHICCFSLLIFLFLLHKLSWEKLYSERRTSQARFPRENRYRWSNPYCDQAFLRYNKEQTDPRLQITPYSPHS